MWSVRHQDGDGHLREEGAGDADLLGAYLVLEREQTAAGQTPPRPYRLERPDTGRKSTGLGLNFVHEIAALHHGEVRVQNRREGGLRADLTIRRLRERGVIAVQGEFSARVVQECVVTLDPIESLGDLVGTGWRIGAEGFDSRNQLDTAHGQARGQRSAQRLAAEATMRVE